MFWTLLSPVLDRSTGKNCRSCGKPIPTDDGYGRSEEVCAPCRG